MKENYIFPAVFHMADDGISIYFPDLPGCLSCADSFELAFKRAKEAFQLHLFGMEEDAEEIPEPSPINEIKIKPCETLAVIEAPMQLFRKKMLDKSARRTVSIPLWLDTLARKENVNYSNFLQESLKNYLGVNNPRL